MDLDSQNVSISCLTAVIILRSYLSLSECYEMSMDFRRSPKRDWDNEILAGHHLAAVA